MTAKERVEKIRKGLEILKDAGVKSSILGDNIHLEIITEDLSLKYKTGEPLQCILKEGEIEMDLSKYMRFVAMHIAQGIPVMTFELFPEKLVMYPERVRVRYGE